MSSRHLEFLDITDAATFDQLPPCADPRFDHRSCDYWEDEVHGEKAARPSWWQARSEPARERRPMRSNDVFANPFAPSTQEPAAPNPFAPPTVGPVLFGSDEPPGVPAFNPFAPPPPPSPGDVAADRPRKLRLLQRGRGVFGSYAKIALLGGEPAAYAQFGPLTAYPRAQRIRELYPRLPQSPLPAVITCIAATGPVRGQGVAAMLIEAVARDLAQRGFAAVEAYPDTTLAVDAASAARPDFWLGCGFALAVDDERYPVMRRALG